MKFRFRQKRAVTPRMLVRQAKRPQSVYIGGNRLLTRITVNGKEFVFHNEANDKLITPGFVTSGRYDDSSTAFILNTVRRDFRCVDAGTNFGYFTCLLARICVDGKVIGIEADNQIAQLARDNVLINNLHEVAEVRHAAANATGEAVQLYRRVGRSGNTSMIALGADYTDFMNEPAVQPFEVAGLRVDDLLAGFKGRIDFLKIDVEGAEPLVLAGARDTIAFNQHLTVLMEWSPGQMQAAGFDVASFLREIEKQGLAGYVLEAGKAHAVSFSQIAHMPYQSGIVFSRNLLKSEGRSDA